MPSFRNALLAGAVLAAGALTGGQAMAGAAWEFTTAGSSFSNGNWFFGQAFTVNANVSATGLGYYADPGTGLVIGDPVALFSCADAACETTGTLLASANVTNIYPLFGHFRYVTITPVALTAGQAYEVVGISNISNYTWADPGFATDPAISLLPTYNGGTDRWLLNSSNSSTPTFLGGGNYTSNLGGSDGYWGANVFLGTPVFATPEPASMALLGAGLAGMGLIRRRRRG